MADLVALPPCDAVTFRERIVVGDTSLTPQEVQDVVQDMGEVYKGNAYHLLQRCVGMKQDLVHVHASRAHLCTSPSAQELISAHCLLLLWLRRNCNTFSNDLCKRLTGKEAPAWVRCKLCMSAMFCTVRKAAFCLHSSTFDSHSQTCHFFSNR